MSPILATTLNVKNSPPVKLRGGKLAYIKTDLCRKVMGEALLPLVELHERGIIHRDMKPQNILICQVTPVRLRSSTSRLTCGWMVSDRSHADGATGTCAPRRLANGSLGS